MNANQSLIKQIEESCSSIPGIQTLFTTANVKVVKQKGTSSEKIIGCSLYHLFIFGSKNVKKNLKVKEQILWSEVAELNSQNDKSFSIILKDGKIYTFSCRHAIELMVSIANHIKSIISKPSLPKFNFNEQYLIGFKYPRDAMEKRIRYMAFKNNIELNSEFLEKIKSITDINVKCHTLNFKDFEDYPHYFPLILDSLEFFPSINKILVPKLNQGIKIWKTFSEFIPKNQTILSFETHEPLTSHFIEFADSFNENNKIKNIAFHDNIFNENFVIKLSHMVGKGNFQSLSIVNRLNLKGYQMLRPLLLSNNGFQSIQTLRLSACKYVVIDDIIESIHDLHVLILDNCNLDLTSIFKYISSNPPDELTDLQLNGNMFMTPIDFDIILPPKLTKLSLDDVEMQNDELIKIMKSLNNSYKTQSIFTLSVINCKQSESQWEIFYSFIENFDCIPLKKLIFDKNPIQEGICNFIKNSPCLKTLSLRGCLSYDTPFLQKFGLALSQNKSLLQLFISGESNKYLSQSLKPLIEDIKKNTTIRVLDISNNHSGDSIIPKLLELFSINDSISELYFDQNNIRPVTFKKFLTDLQSEDACAIIHLPKVDLKKGNAVNKEIFEMQAIIQILMKKLAMKIKNSQVKDYRKNDVLENIDSDEKQNEEFLTEESTFPYTIKLASKLPPETRAEIQKINDNYINNHFLSNFKFLPETNEDEEIEQLKKEYSIQILKEKICKE